MRGKDLSFFESVRSFARTFAFKEVELPLIERRSRAIESILDSADNLTRKPVLLAHSDQSTLFRFNGLISLLPHIGRDLLTSSELYYFADHFFSASPDRASQGSSLAAEEQFGVLLRGNLGPETDTGLVFLVDQLKKFLGQSAKTSVIGTAGCQNCRPVFFKVLRQALKSQSGELCSRCRLSLSTPPGSFEIYDCHNPICRRLIDAQETILDRLCLECKGHLELVFEQLELMRVPFELEPRLHLPDLFRGRINFRLTDEKDEEIAFGGSFESFPDLIGKSESVAGFVWRKSVDKKSRQTLKPVPVFVAQIGREARLASLKILADLWSNGIMAPFLPDRSPLKDQLLAAQKSRSRFAIIIGHKEAIEGQAMIRNLESGAQETLLQEEIIGFLKDQLFGPAAA